MKQSFWKTISGPFSVASVYVGALVGPALVAGTYATVFYLSNGCNSLWLPFLACGIVGLMCLSASEIIRHYKIYEYGALSKKVYGGKRIFTILFDIYVFLSNVVGTSIILNMSGTFLTELTGVSTIVGMILIAIITVILVKYRDKLIRYANSIMTIVLLVGFVVISLLVVYLFGPQVKALLSSWYVPEGVSIWSGLWSCCKYAFASSAFALTMCCVEQPIETHKQSCLLGIFILILGGLLQAISCFTFLPFVDEVMNDPLPLVYVMNNYLSAAYPWIRTCYYILMLLAIVSSTIPATYMISSRYQSALKFIGQQPQHRGRHPVYGHLHADRRARSDEPRQHGPDDRVLHRHAAGGHSAVLHLAAAHAQIPPGGARAGCRRAEILTSTPPPPVSVCRVGADKTRAHLHSLLSTGILVHTAVVSGILPGVHPLNASHQHGHGCKRAAGIPCGSFLFLFPCRHIIFGSRARAP